MRSFYSIADHHDHHPLNTIEVTKSVSQFSHSFGWPTAEQRLQTPLTLVGVTRVENHVLVVVLNGVNLADHIVMPVVEPNKGHDFAGPRFQPRVGLDVFLHRLSNGPRPVLQPFILLHPVELFDHLIRNVEACSHTASSDSPT
jgi:hypothetical protein